MEGDPMDELEAEEEERMERRWEADIEQASMEAEGNRHWRKIDRMMALRKEGKLIEAAELCPHSGGYPLMSLAADLNRDPREGEEGVRCGYCGSVINGFRNEVDEVVVMFPCEIASYLLPSE